MGLQKVTNEGANNRELGSVTVIPKKNYGIGNSYTNNILAEMSNPDSKLNNFFSMLVSKYDEKIAGKMKIISEQANIFYESIHKGRKTVDLFNEILEKKGSHMSYKIDLDNNTITLKIGKEEFKFNESEFTYENILKNFEYRFLIRTSWYWDIREKNNLLTRIDLLKRDLKKTLFKKKKLSQKLVEQEEALNKLTNALDQSEKDRKNITELSNPANENCFYFYNAIEAIKKEYFSRMTLKELSADGRNLLLSEINEEVVQEAYTDLVERGYQNYTSSDFKELLKEVFLTLDKVEIKARRGEYENTDTNNVSFKTLQIIEWFIDNVYESDPEFVKRNGDQDRGETRLFKKGNH